MSEVENGNGVASDETVTDTFPSSFSSSRGYGRTYAKMPAARFASEYNMNHPKRGIALIFNHENFDIPSLKSRAGTNVDCENLSNTLKNLHFNVSIFKDFKQMEMMHEIDGVAKMDHSHYDCILVCILSHGEFGYLYSKDQHYKLEQITSYFTADRCPSLAGKPKLFFIQACQGDRLDAGVSMRATTETDANSSISYSIPVHADFLIAYSTIPGFYSWRNTTKGSWFMQSLCAELDENGKRYDLLTLLTFVSQRVAYDFESNTPDTPTMHQQKQIPCTTTMLTRILKFNDKMC
jgi:caspase-like apoptosis-related cysteine protease